MTQVWIGFPIAAFLVNGSFLVMAVIRDPFTYAVGLGLWLTFLPVYLFNKFIACKYRAVSKFMSKFISDYIRYRQSEHL